MRTKRSYGLKRIEQATCTISHCSNALPTAQSFQVCQRHYPPRGHQGLRGSPSALPQKSWPPSRSSRDYNGTYSSRRQKLAEQPTTRSCATNSLNCSRTGMEHVVLVGGLTSVVPMSAEWIAIRQIMRASPGSPELRDGLFFDPQKQMPRFAGHLIYCSVLSKLFTQPA